LTKWKIKPLYFVTPTTSGKAITMFKTERKTKMKLSADQIEKLNKLNAVIYALNDAQSYDAVIAQKTNETWDHIIDVMFNELSQSFAPFEGEQLTVDDFRNIYFEGFFGPDSPDWQSLLNYMHENHVYFIECHEFFPNGEAVRGGAGKISIAGAKRLLRTCHSFEESLAYHVTQTALEAMYTWHHHKPAKDKEQLHAHFEGSMYQNENNYNMIYICPSLTEYVWLNKQGQVTTIIDLETR